MPAGPPCDKTSCLVAWSLMVANGRPWLRLFRQVVEGIEMLFEQGCAQCESGPWSQAFEWANHGKPRSPVTPMTHSCHSSDTIRALRTQDLDKQTRSSFGDCRGIAASRDTDITNSRGLLAGVAFVKGFFCYCCLMTLPGSLYRWLDAWIVSLLEINFEKTGMTLYTGQVSTGSEHPAHAKMVPYSDLPKSLVAEAP